MLEKSFFAWAQVSTPCHWVYDLKMDGWTHDEFEDIKSCLI